MSPYRGARKQRRFKPAFDILENRALPSGLSDVAGVNIDPLPMPPVDVRPGGVVSVSANQLKLMRGGDAASFSVVLDSQPSAEVDVTLAQYERPSTDPSNGSAAPAPGTQLTIDQHHLAFTADNWNQAQSVKVSAPAAPTPLPDERIWIFGTTTSSDANFDAQPVPPVQV